MEWRKAIDSKDGTVYILPEGKDLVIDMGEEALFKGFSFLPDKKTREGLILEYQLSVSKEGKNWEKISEGEFSNIENNPIRQTVETGINNGRYIKFSPVRLSEGKRGAIADFKILKGE